MTTINMAQEFATRFEWDFLRCVCISFGSSILLLIWLMLQTNNDNPVQFTFISFCTVHAFVFLFHYFSALLKYYNPCPFLRVYCVECYVTNTFILPLSSCLMVIIYKTHQGAYSTFDIILSSKMCKMFGLCPKSKLSNSVSHSQCWFNSHDM